MSKETQATIIAGMKWSWAYHRLKQWGYSDTDICFIIHFGSNSRMMTGDIRFLMSLLENPTMARII